MDFHLSGRDRNGKPGPLWLIVRNTDAAAVGGHDGLAQAQAQTDAPSAVCDGVAAGVEHLEDLGLFRVRDARAVVGNADHRIALLPFCLDDDGVV